MKTKRDKMIRRMVKKDLLALLKQVPPEHQGELDSKIRDLTKQPKTKDSWKNLINLIEYYIAKGTVEKSGPKILNALGEVI